MLLPTAERPRAQGLHPTDSPEQVGELDSALVLRPRRRLLGVPAVARGSCLWETWVDGEGDAGGWGAVRSGSVVPPSRQRSDRRDGDRRLRAPPPEPAAGACSSGMLLPRGRRRDADVRWR